MKQTTEAVVAGARAPALSRQILRVAAGIAILTLSARVQVPFWPVPMTLQVAAVMTLAALYGMRLGTATLAGYLAVGALGLPVFAGTPEKGIGLAYMLGATGGYLVGFLIASALVGFAADRLHRLALWPAMLLGLAVIYALGLGWLAQFVPADKLLAYGMTPFVAGDLVKVTLAALLVTKLPQGWAERLRGGALNG